MDIVLNQLRMSYCYAHRLVHLSTLMREASFCRDGDYHIDSPFVRVQRMRCYGVPSPEWDMCNTPLLLSLGGILEGEVERL